MPDQAALIDTLQRENAALRQRITELEQTESSLRTSEAKFRGVIEQSTDVIAVFDEAGRLSDWNAAAERLTGLPRQRVIGQPFSVLTEQLAWTDAQLADKAAVAQQVIEAARTGHAPFFFRPAEVSIRAASGECRIIEQMPFPIQTEHGYQIGSISRDITERKRAEETLRASEANLRAAFDATDDSLFLLAADETVLALNAIAAQRMGQPRENLIGRKVYDLLPPEVADRRRPYVERALRDGEAVTFEDERNGRWMVNHLYPILDASRRVARLMVVSRDSTDRKRAERDVHKLARAAEQSPLTIVITNTAGSIEYVNPKFTQTTGYTLAEAIGQNPRILKSGHTTDLEYQHLWNTIASGGEWRGEFCNKKKNGDLYWEAATIGPVWDEHGLITHFVAVKEDITALKQMQDALIASEARWAFALEGAGDGVWDMDVLTEQTYFSPQWKAMLGYAEHEIGNALNEWTDRVHPDDLPAALAKVQRHVDEHTPTYQSEYRLRAKDGTYRWVLARGKVISRTPAGQPGRIIGTHTDITARKQMEEALRESEEKYRSVVTALSEGVVLQNAAGEIVANNPAAERVLGLTADQMMGRTSMDPRWRSVQADGSPFPGEEHPAMVTLRTGQPLRNVVMGVHRPTGELTWLSINSEPLYHPAAPQPYAVVTTFADITERKQVEEAMAALTLRNQTLLQTASDGIHVVDDEGHVVEVNAKFCAMLGYSRDELLHLTIADWDAHWSAEELRVKIHALIASPATFETRHRRKDGTLRDVEINAVGVRLEGRNYLYASVRDITDRKRLELTLRDSEERFRQMFMKHTAVMLIVEPDTGAIVGANHAAEQFYGYPMAHLCTLSITDLNQLPFDQVHRERQSALREEQNYFVFPHRLANGDTRTVEVHSSPIALENRLVLFSIIHDITDRKRMEEALRASEVKARAIIEQSREGIVLLDEHGLIIEWNPAQAQMTGISRAEALGQPAWEIQIRQAPIAYRTPEQIEVIKRSLLNLLATGQSPLIDRTIEGVIETASGDLKHFVQNNFLIKTDQGYWVGAVVHDITARKEAEKALRASEERYRTLAEVAPDMIFVIDCDDRVQYVNSLAARLFSTTPDQVIGRPRRELFPPEIYDLHTPWLRQIIETGEPIAAEGPLVREGHTLWTTTSLVPLRAADGTLTAVMGITHDITARKQTEALLERRAAQATVINEIGQQITAALAVDDVLARAAQLIHERLGMQHVGIFVFTPDRTELVLRGRAGNFVHLFAADHRLKIGQGLVGWAAQHSQRLLANDVQGDPRYVNVYGEDLPTRSELAVPILSAGVVQGVLDVQSPQMNAFDQDDVLTQQTLAGQIAVALENARLYEEIQQHTQQLEQRVADRTAELQAANVRLTELDRLKDEFLSRISHELRTPLTSILIALELLETSKPERRERYIQRLKDATIRLRDLIEDVLMFSQLNQAMDTARFDQIDVNDWIEGRLTTWQTKCAQRNLAFQLDLPPDLPQAAADAELVLQVLTRLLTNAVNYTPAGTVTLSTDLRDEAGRRWVTIGVTDTGPGLTPEDLPHIFDRFYRGRAAADYKTAGSGIGLTISREIAERLGGRLTVETQVGVGSTFTLWLRAVSAQTT